MKRQPWAAKVGKALVALLVGWLVFYGVLVIRRDFAAAFKLVVRGTYAAGVFALAANVGFVLLYVFSRAKGPLWRFPWSFLVPVALAGALGFGIVVYRQEPLSCAWGVALFISIPALSAYLTACWLNYRSPGPRAG